MDLNKIFIDTNIYSLAMRGDPAAVNLLQTMDEIVVNPVVIGELLSGFKAGRWEMENRKELSEFLKSSRIKMIQIDEDTSELYSDIINQLRESGKPIPTNDIWIAASAMQYEIPLYTMDSHFKHIKNLNLL